MSDAHQPAPTPVPVLTRLRARLGEHMALVLAVWTACMVIRAALWHCKGGRGRVGMLSQARKNTSQNEIELAVLGNSSRGAEECSDDGWTKLWP